MLVSGCARLAFRFLVATTLVVAVPGCRTMGSVVDGHDAHEVTEEVYPVSPADAQVTPLGLYNWRRTFLARPFETSDSSSTKCREAVIRSGGAPAQSADSLRL